MSAEETSLADLLRLAREQRGETVEHVHQQTGISKKIIRGLDGGDTGVIEPVYMRLAALTYAQYLGLDVDRVAEVYDAQSGHRRPETLLAPVQSAPTELSTARDAFPKPLSSRGDLPTRLKTIPPAQIVVLAAVGVVVALIFYWFYWLSDSPPEGLTPPPTKPPVAATTRQVEPGMAETEELGATDPALVPGISEPSPRATSTVTPGRDSRETGSSIRDTVAEERVGAENLALSSAPDSQASPSDPAAADGEGSAAADAEAPPEAETSPRREADGEESDSAAPSQRSTAAGLQRDDPGDIAAADVQDQPLPDAPGGARPLATAASDARRVGEGVPAAAGQIELPPLILQAHAVDSTWVRVRWDGLGSNTEIIPPGEDRLWQARDFFIVRAGRAHGVRFTFQDSLLGNGRLGEATEVLLFRASREGVALLESDAVPVSPSRDSTATSGLRQ